MAKGKKRVRRTTPLPAPGAGSGGKLIRGIPVLLVLILASIPFAYGKYREFCINGAYDGGLNVYTAQVIVEGGKLGTDVVAFAAPSTLLSNVIGVWLLGYSEAGPKLIQMLMQMAALGLMFYTLRKFYGSLGAGFAVVMAAFFLSYPLHAKYGNVKEQFMIACMIVAVCGVMLRHAGGSSFWLILSGAVAINAYFYKQTGASVIIAIAIYLIAQPIFRQRTWRRFGGDIGLLLAGAVIGFAPLMILFTWQGKLLDLLGGIPVLGGIIHMLKTGQVKAALGGEYIAGSREVTSFTAQYEQVVRYYHSFVVPIGLGLMAIGWRLGVVFKRVVSVLVGGKRADGSGGENGSAKSTSASVRYPSAVPLEERFVLLLAVWWLLDMAFVWISPRAYVQYFLPLNGSAAMLGAYALWRCRKHNVGWPVLLAVWIVVEMLIVWLKPLNSWPWLTFASSGPAEYWGGFTCHVIAFVVTVVVCVALRGERRQTLRRVILSGLAIFVALWWVGVFPLPGAGGSASRFASEISRLRQQRRAGVVASWEQVGHWIKANSEPDDGIYVWGWFPGIYVAAQRYCPAKRPAYSDMHSDKPDRVGSMTRQLVKQLRKNPPRYIVDSQKIHYPFYDHAVFDLWPRWRDEKKTAFNLKYSRGQPPLGIFLAPGRLHETQALMAAQVEGLSYQLLTNPRRQGGPELAEKARAAAQDERARHEQMLPLREYVMSNYRPVKLPIRTNMFVFEYKGP